MSDVSATVSEQVILLTYCGWCLIELECRYRFEKKFGLGVLYMEEDILAASIDKKVDFTPSEKKWLGQ